MHQPLALSHLSGDWRRSLLTVDNGRSDTTSNVRWLQGPSLFCDLRQVVPMPKIKAACLRALSLEEIVTLTTQEGFAGRLIQDGLIFEWVRWLDVQPPLVVKDRATLAWENDVLIETGHHSPYIEHWRRDRGKPSVTSALHLHDQAERRAAVLVITSDRFAFARKRSMPLNAGLTLRDLVQCAPTLAGAQDIVDCEISHGFLDGWVIERSTLPWRIGKSLEFRRDETRITLNDVDPDGRSCRRSYDILEEETSKTDFRG